MWWVRRDARIEDNAALAAAAAAALTGGGSLAVIYVYDPQRCQRAIHASHIEFINEGLVELDLTLKRRNRNGQVVFRIGGTAEVLQGLSEEAGPICGLHSHSVVGDLADQLIDAEVRAWCCATGVSWIQHDQYGLRLQEASQLEELEDGERRQLHAQEPPARCPATLPRFAALAAGSPVPPEELGLLGARRPEQERGGEAAAQEFLRTWVTARGEAYNAEKSAPLLAWSSNSRLGPFLAWGHISLRSVKRAVEAKQAGLAEVRVERHRKRWQASLLEISSRLDLRVAFMQGILDVPEMVAEPRHPSFEEVRSRVLDAETAKVRDAWLQGRTGYPMVDACMRCLQRSGWLNMRMRALVLSFAAYDLFLDWRVFADELAELMLDYEPGIHYYQLQSGSGTDGIEYRMYNPTKQLWDNDPTGEFVRRYVPELSPCPLQHLAEPWMMPLQEQIACGVVVGDAYPAPIVNHTEALRRARARLAPLECRASARLQSELPKEERPCGASLSLQQQQQEQQRRRQEAAAARGYALRELRGGEQATAAPPVGCSLTAHAIGPHSPAGGGHKGARWRRTPGAKSCGGDGGDKAPSEGAPPGVGEGACEVYPHAGNGDIALNESATASPNDEACRPRHNRWKRPVGAWDR